MVLLQLMKVHLFSIFFLASVVLAQTPVYSDFVTGTAQTNVDQVTFYLENVSSCVLSEIQVRLAFNQIAATEEGATFITKLQPKTQGTFVMRLAQPGSEKLAWTIDAVTLEQPLENPTCPQIGVVAFEKLAVASAPQVADLAAPEPTVNRAVTRDYTVVAGDSWWGIAQRFGTTPEVMATLNDRTTTALKVGEVIKVPAPTAPTPLEQTLAAQTTSDSATLDSSTLEGATSGSVASGGEPLVAGFALHTVQQGDTLFGIAKTYDSSVPLIRQANCLNEKSVLSVTQVLQIPPKDAQLTNTCN
jgi:LysM repeat protein